MISSAKSAHERFSWDLLEEFARPTIDTFRKCRNYDFAKRKTANECPVYLLDILILLPESEKIQNRPDFNASLMDCHPMLLSFNWAIRILALLSFILLSGCFFISDAEIERRILSALPENMEINLGRTVKRIDCLTAEFVIEGDLDELEALNIARNLPGLGVNWAFNESVAEYVNDIEDEIDSSITGGTILSARNCFERTDFNFRDFSDMPSVATRTERGDQVLVLFDRGSYLSGAYMAH